MADRSLSNDIFFTCGNFAKQRRMYRPACQAIRLALTRLIAHIISCTAVYTFNCKCIKARMFCFGIVGKPFAQKVSILFGICSKIGLSISVVFQWIIIERFFDGY